MLRLRRMPLAQLRLRALLKPSQSKPYGFASSPKGESFIKVKIMSETKLSHFDASGSAVMVDVSEKPVTARQAVARGIITMNAAAFAAVRDGTAQKGDVLGVARIAGIMAAKRTSELIPLCHPLPLSKLTVDFHLLPEHQAVEAVCTARTIGVTGVEMEALTGVSAALLTIYDMCKAVDKGMELGVSVTDLCNLRCRYCMPDGVPKLAHEDILTYEEFLRLAALFAQCGIDTVRITGGEPLVRRGVEQLTAGLKAIPGIRRVALTTNGVLLAQKLPALLAAGLDSVNISLDTLHPETFRRITGKDELAAVQNGIRAALASGIPVKLNCVPQPGVNEGELESLAAFAQEHPLQVRFIEMMPIGFGAGLPGLSGPELLERFYRRWPRLQPVTGAAFGDGPAVYYSAPGWRGSIGLIAAVHGKFCASCNRVRLTSQGFLRPCLASESGTDLRALLRSGADDAALLQAIQNTILAKPREHHFGQGSMPATRGMYRIGG